MLLQKLQHRGIEVLGIDHLKWMSGTGNSCAIRIGEAALELIEDK